MLWLVLALGAFTAFLLLAVLGAMRETVLLRAEVSTLADLVRNPPAPSFVGDRAPEALIRAIQHSGEPATAGARLVAFLSPGCGPCEDLVNNLQAAVKDDRLPRDQLFFAIWAATPQQAEAFAPRVPGPYFLDGNGVLSRACEIRATPTVLIVSQDDYTVVDYSLEEDTEWMISRLRSLSPLAAA